MTARPYQRTRKADRLLSPGSSRDEIVVDMAVGPFDHAVRAADLKWGVDQLPRLVSPELAAKYGSALAKLNAAIEASDPDETRIRAEVCIRGLAALDAAATAAGQPQADPDVIEHRVGDFSFAIIKDDRAWPALKARRPDLLFFTLTEVGNALKVYQQAVAHPMVAAVKDAFPTATITAIRPRKSNADLDDEIPF